MRPPRCPRERRWALAAGPRMAAGQGRPRGTAREVEPVARAGAGAANLGTTSTAGTCRPPSPSRSSPSLAYRPRVAGSERPAASSGGFRRRRCRREWARGSRAWGSWAHIASFLADACATRGLPELRGERRVVGTEAVDPACGPTRRNRCRAPDFRRKWRKTDRVRRSSGYHADASFECPYAGKDPGDGSAPLLSDRILLPQDRAWWLPVSRNKLGSRGVGPIYRLGTETTRQGEG